MNHPDVSVRCQRCGTPMDLKDPGPEDPWASQQFWECPRCNRHFWTTYPPAKPAKPVPKPAARPAAAGPAPAAAPARPTTMGAKPPTAPK